MLSIGSSFLLYVLYILRRLALDSYKSPSYLNRQSAGIVNVYYYT